MSRSLLGAGSRRFIGTQAQNDKKSIVKILGAGSMGCIVAHELAKSDKAVPILLFKSALRLNLYKAEGSKIKVTRPKAGDVETSSAEIAGQVAPLLSLGKNEPIENLIISTKSYVTRRAIAHCVPLLDANSNILILQNGMGMAESLRKEFWPNLWKAPTFYEAISTHGAYKRSNNAVNHVGLGKLTFAPAPGNRPDRTYEDAPDMIQALIESPELNAKYVSQDDMLITQMEKLVVNACINPITALLDCLNGDLVYGSKMTLTMKSIIHEAVKCFNAEFGNQLQSRPDAATRLNPQRLLKTVFEVISTTAENSSSMREDVRKSNRTEVDVINGYILRLGSKHGIPTRTNDLMVSMIYNKVSIDRGIERAALERAMQRS